MNEENKKWIQIPIDKKETSDRISGKITLTYTSWQKAWKLLFSTYPQSKIEVLHRKDIDGNILEYHGNEEIGYSVFVRLAIPEIGYDFTERLAILDSANKPQKLATYEYQTKYETKVCCGMLMDDVCNTIQRCTVKNIARAGIGLNVYEGDFSDVKKEHEYIDIKINFEEIKEKILNARDKISFLKAKSSAIVFKSQMTNEQVEELKSIINNKNTELENIINKHN